MQVRELIPILRLHEVQGVAWVDGDGTTLAEVGTIPDILVPHLVGLLRVWDESMLETHGNWREIHTNDWTLLVRRGDSGVLLILTGEDANLGQIRLATRELMVHLDQMGKIPRVERGFEGVGR